MNAQEYADMTLEELQAEQRSLYLAIEEIRAQQQLLLPYLDAVWREQNKADAAQADPNLTQGIG